MTKITFRSLSILLLCVPALLIANLSSGKETSKPVKAAHFVPPAATASSERGKKAFAARNCASCHSIEGRGGCLAPPLDGIGARRDEQFIASRITDSAEARREFQKLYPQPELMPHPRIKKDQAEIITAFLLTLPEPKKGYVIGEHKVRPGKSNPAQTAESKATAASIAQGKALFNSHGCIACHGIGNIGGHFAPRLDGISQHRDRQYIVDRISVAELLTDNGEYQERGAVMPPSDLTEPQIQKIANFLMSLPPSP